MFFQVVQYGRAVHGGPLCAWRTRIGPRPRRVYIQGVVVRYCHGAVLVVWGAVLVLMVHVQGMT